VKGNSRHAGMLSKFNFHPGIVAIPALDQVLELLSKALDLQLAEGAASPKALLYPIISAKQG
jgi:hypothetical protein